MITFKDYNLNLIRDFSTDQFLSHIKLVEDIRACNDFGNMGIETLLDSYLDLIHGFQEEINQGKEEFRLSENQVLLYDLIIEITRLCYKHSCLTSSDPNDWENEF